MHLSILHKKTTSRNSVGGSVLVAALIILAVTFVAVSATLFEATHRFRVSHQSSRWAQAGQAAEAGAEIGFMTAQKKTWVADGWSGTPGAVGAPAVTKSVVLVTGPGSEGVNASIAVDTINVSGASWLRIRSTGKADLAGGNQEGIDRSDLLLRKVSLIRDRYTNAALSAPQATRMVELLARPKSPFSMAILLDKKFTMEGGGNSGLIDAFNSSLPDGDSDETNNGLWAEHRRIEDGATIGVNDTQGTSDLGNVDVFGDVSWSGNEPARMDGVTGDKISPFSQPVSPVTAPSWTASNANPTVIDRTMTLRGGTAAAPATYKVSSVMLDAQKTVTLAPPPGHPADQDCYIEIWVTGNFTSTGSSKITQHPRVHVTYHVQGNVTVTGGTFVNNSGFAAQNIINVINPPNGTTQTVTVTGGGTFVGAINAPGANVTLSGNGSFTGALVGKTLAMSGGAAFHYDQALADLGGSGGGYFFSGITEAVR